jgi:uncharacterized protein
LSDDRYLSRATSIAEFLLAEASPDGALVRSWRDKPGHPAFADDLAATAVGLYTLFSVTGEARWFTAAESLVSRLREDFSDPAGGFFAASTSTHDLITRPKNTQDNPTPSDNSLALEALLMHIALTGDLGAMTDLEATMKALSADALQNPAFGGYSLAIWLTHLAGIKEVAVVGTAEQRNTLTRPIWDQFRPNVVVALGDGSTSTVPLLADRPGGETGLAYVCENLVCDLPVASAQALGAKLGGTSIDDG